MSRHSNRPKRGPAGPAPDSPAGRALGLDDRDIPGGAVHIINPETRATPPALEPAAELFADGSLLDHGVPDERDEAGFTTPSGLVGPPQTAAREPEVTEAVPVYIVDGPKSEHRDRIMTGVSYTVNDPTQPEPTVLAYPDERRLELWILNESQTTDIRVGRLDDVQGGGGALLSHFLNSYTKFHANGELYAYSTVNGSPVKVSVISISHESA